MNEFFKVDDTIYIGGDPQPLQRAENRGIDPVRSEISDYAYNAAQKPCNRQLVIDLLFSDTPDKQVLAVLRAMNKNTKRSKAA